MDDIIKINTYEGILISRDNIIIKTDTNFLELIGFTESEILGKTIFETSKLLRIDSQLNLEELENNFKIFMFTKDLVAIEGTISCKTIDHGIQKIYSFKKQYYNLAKEKFDYSNQFATGRGEGLAIFNFPCLTLINCNQNYLDFLEPAYNNSMASIGRTLKEIYPEYPKIKFDKIIKHIVDTNSTYHIKEVCFPTKILGNAYWNITVVPISEQGTIKCLILSLVNVTEEVLNRRAIKQKNEVLEVVINNISDEIIMFDKDFNIIKTNKNIEKDFIRKKLPLKNLNDIAKHMIAFDKDNQLITYGNFPFQRVAKVEFISNYIVNKRNSTGVVYGEISGSPIYDKDGEFSHGIMVSRNINDRIQAEEGRLIKAQNELLTKVVESLNLECIRCTYPDLDIISVNGNGINKLKETNNEIKSSDYLIGKNYFSIYSGDEEKKRSELNFYLIEEGHYFYTDYTNDTVDGEKRFYKTINQAIFGLNNKVVEIIFITTDITEEVKTKNKMKETLDSQNQIFANISHELKTPLSIIFSASQLIEMYLKKEIDNISKENISKNIDLIKQNCFRFTKLINNIVDLSSMESGFYSLNFSNRNIIEILEDIVYSVRSYVEDKGLTIIFDTEIEEKIMAVDVDKKERIMLNLISNAVKFSPKGGTIYIDIKDKGDYVDIIVRDCGTGIDKKSLNTIFDKYKKVDNSLNRNTEGSGIGLALVKKMVELVEGKISVNSQIGKGTIFTVSLPVRVLDELEVMNYLHPFNKTMDKINIEFSDIYFD